MCHGLATEAMSEKERGRFRGPNIRPLRVLSRWGAGSPAALGCPSSGVGEGLAGGKPRQESASAARPYGSTGGAPYSQVVRPPQAQAAAGCCPLSHAGYTPQNTQVAVTVRMGRQGRRASATCQAA